MHGRALAGAVIAAFAGSPALFAGADRADRAIIAATPNELAGQASVIVIGRAGPGGRFTVERYVKGEGPARIAIGPSAMPRGQVIAFAAQRPGRPGEFDLLPFGTDGALSVFPLVDGRVGAGGPAVSEIAAASARPGPRFKLREAGPEIE